MKCFLYMYISFDSLRMSMKICIWEVWYDNFDCGKNQKICVIATQLAIQDWKNFKLCGRECKECWTKSLHFLGTMIF